MTKEANPKPPYCASCFQSENVRYVDFEAAYDGPVIPGTPTPIPIDDLILCENCLNEAFAVIDPQNLKETINELQQIVRELIEDNEAKDRFIKGAESTISELVDHPIAKLPGKPKLVAVSDEVREQITKNRYARRGTTSAPKKPADKARREELKV